MYPAKSPISSGFFAAQSGPVKAVFYCPLVGEVTDDEGFSSPVDGRFLKSYAWAVEKALEADTADDEMDMAEFFDEDDGVKAKLVSAKWGVETYRGRLFGRIECSLKEERTDAETEILTDWISGQNSDGYGEHFEQQPIDTEDGDLYPVVFEYAGQEVAAVHITVNDGKDIPNELIYGTIKGYTCSAPQDNKRFKP